jgi:hypothetical protein
LPLGLSEARVIIRKSGMYYGSYNDRLYPIVAWHFYANTCIFGEHNEAYDYYPDVWLQHYLMQGDEGVVTDGELTQAS